MKPALQLLSISIATAHLVSEFQQQDPATASGSRSLHARHSVMTEPDTPVIAADKLLPGSSAHESLTRPSSSSLDLPAADEASQGASKQATKDLSPLPHGSLPPVDSAAQTPPAIPPVAGSADITSTYPSDTHAGTLCGGNSSGTEQADAGCIKTESVLPGVATVLSFNGYPASVPASQVQMHAAAAAALHGPISQVSPHT